MKFLCTIFLCMAVYGLATEYKGAGLLALVCAGLTVYGSRQLDKRDAEYRADPRSAIVETDTLELLTRQGSEGTRSRF